MPTLFTFDLTANSKAVNFKANDAIHDDGVDFRCAVISIDDIAKVTLEENDTDGINIIFRDGDKYPIHPSNVTRVGLHDKSPGTYGTDSQGLLDDLIELIGW
jgi:hypothetical protein